MPTYLLEPTPTVADGALEVPHRGMMKGILHGEAALFLDEQMFKLSRAHARLGLRLGEALMPMMKRKGYMALGHSKAADYCHEELGISKSTGERLVRLHVGLQKFPLVAADFREGKLSECQTLLLLAYLPKLGGEAGWVQKARELTVRGLEAALTEARGRTEGAPVVAASAEHTLRHYRIDPATFIDWQLGREIAGRVAKADLNDWQFLEFLAAEFMAGPCPRATDEPVPEGSRPAESRPPSDLWQILEEEYGRWGYFDWDPVPVELAPELEQPLPEGLHERQRAIVDLFLCRRRLHLHMGRMLFTFNRLSLWRHAGFASLVHYAQERLGLSTTTAHRLIHRERQFLEHPRVYKAVWKGELSSTTADALFPILSEIPDSCQNAWIAFATRTTTRQVEAVVKATCDLARTDHETFRMTNYLPPHTDTRASQIRGRARRCDEPVDFPALLGPVGVVVGWAASWLPMLTFRPADPSVTLVVRVPNEVAGLVEEAERVAAAYGARTPSEALRVMLDGFISTWSKADLQLRAQTRRLLEAADYRCQVPACSGRAELERHHLKFRSQGGGNEDANQAVSCRMHHQGGIHTGLVQAKRLPNGAIRWELGRVNEKAFRVFHNETRVAQVLL